MTKQEYYSQFKTDEERMKCLENMTADDWMYLGDWEGEAKPENKQYIHDMMFRMYESGQYDGCVAFRRKRYE